MGCLNRGFDVVGFGLGYCCDAFAGAGADGL